jgi:hypothetical protein
LCNGCVGFVMDICWGWLLLIQRVLSSISKSMRKDSHLKFDPEILEAFKWLSVKSSEVLCPTGSIILNKINFLLTLVLLSSISLIILHDNEIFAQTSSAPEPITDLITIPGKGVVYPGLPLTITALQSHLTK